MRGLLIFLLVCLVGCASPKYVSIQVSGSDALSKIKILGEFSSKDYQDVNKSLKLISYLAPELSFTNRPKFSWMDSEEFAGLTIVEGYKEIFIDKKFKMKNFGNLDYFKFGFLCGHELQHFERGMNEADVQSTVDDRLFLISQREYQRIIDYNWK